MTDDPAQAPAPAAGFSSLGLDDALVAAVADLGYEEPTPIQREAIPPLLEGRDLLGRAATGTGKTAAFTLPLLQRVAAPGEQRTGVRLLVLVPTRELAMQVAEAVHRYGKPFGVRVLPIYGGQSIQQQLRVLKRGVDVVVATPGRALDHIGRGTLDLAGVRAVVLDEADEMLDMGFAEDLEAILDATPAERQTALFSATMPPRVAAIARRHLRDPVQLVVGAERLEPGEVPRVRQVAYVVQRQHKKAALARVLDMENPTAAIVFCRTRTEVDDLAESLNARGYRAESLHGGLSQEQRDRVMRRFREGVADLLIATDVAARGLDVELVTHVINFDVPSSPDAYVHRIGRTGRAGRAGAAITLAEPREHRLLRNVEQVTRQKIRIETVPTVHDLRARRLELTRVALQEALASEDLDSYRFVVESLAAEHDVLDVAAAAVKLAHAAGGAPDEEDIPTATRPPDRGDGGRERPGRASLAAAGGKGGRGRARADGAGREAPSRLRAARERTDIEAGTGARAGRARGEKTAPRGRRTQGEVTRIFVGAGRKLGLRPADLVGAIANEAGIDSRAIGAIEIGERFAVVEVPEEAADEIIIALRETTIRGKRVPVRRDRET